MDGYLLGRSRVRPADGRESLDLFIDGCLGEGIRTFDPEKALKAYAHEAMKENGGVWSAHAAAW